VVEEPQFYEFALLNQRITEEEPW